MTESQRQQILRRFEQQCEERQAWLLRSMEWLERICRGPRIIIDILDAVSWLGSAFG
ncbi:MAG TPA: hypothetical protein VD866_29515 [Urbifossiella sp.]|nr:hypothetical protein [Urbifossiella sp.]